MVFILDASVALAQGSLPLQVPYSFQGGTGGERRSGGLTFDAEGTSRRKLRLRFGDVALVFPAAAPDPPRDISAFEKTLHRLQSRFGRTKSVPTSGTLRD